MGGFTGVHQFCRVGAHAMIAAGSIVLQDVPPFVTAAGLPGQAARAPTTRACAAAGSRGEDILAVRRAYKTLYREGLSLDEARAQLAAAAAPQPLLAPLVEFLAAAGRGIIR